MQICTPLGRAFSYLCTQGSKCLLVNSATSLASRNTPGIQHLLAEASITSSLQPSPPVEDGEYEVQKIITERGRGPTQEFLVRWKGFGQEEDSWLRREELTGAPRVLEKWERLSHLRPWKR